MTSRVTLALLVGAPLLASGCLQVLGLGDYRDGATAGAAATTSSATSTAASTGSSAGGQGGGATSCTPGQSYPCYDGPPATNNKGICHPGTHVCQPDGVTFDACAGERLPQMEVCSMKGDEDCNGFACSETIWANALAANPSVIAVAEDGSSFIAFSFSGSLKVGTTTLVSTADTDLGVAKLDPAGKALWAKSFGTAHRDLPIGIAVDANGPALVANMGGLGDTFGFGPNNVDGGIVAIRLGLDGSPQWATSCHAGALLSTYGGGIGIDAAGSVTIGASLYGTPDCGGGPMPIPAFSEATLVARFSPTGQYQWAHTFAPPSQQQSVALESLALDPAGSVLLTGSINAPVAFGSGFGVPTLTPNGRDMFVAKLTPGGGYGYSAIFGDSSAQWGHSIAADGAGNAIVGGDFQGTMQIGPSTLTATSGDVQAFVAKLDPNGTPTFAKAFGDASAVQTTQAVAVDGKGDIFALGFMAGSADFGGGTVASNGGAVFVAALTGAGAFRWQRVLPPIPAPTPCSERRASS